MRAGTRATEIHVGSRVVGSGRPAYVIAEAGSNHDGDLDLAFGLIDAAVDARCDAVKFQVFKADSLMVPDGKSAHYLADSVGSRGLYGLFEQMAMDRSWLDTLVSRCADRGIDFLATPFDTEAVRLLVDSGSKALKIASSELWHAPLIECASASGLPLIMSTGMSELPDIERAVATARAAGATGLALLQCTVSYPTPPDQVNLRVMETLAGRFDAVVGFSDHTTGIWAPLAAVALGAQVIEKHFTLDRSRSGPDHRFALEPNELAAMVRGIRDVEASLGIATKTRSSAEEEIFQIGRRNVVAARSLRRGEVIGPDDVVVLRSALGIDPHRLGGVFGRRLTADVEAFAPLQWEDLA